jgi:hypothetical protein
MPGLYSHTSRSDGTTLTAAIYNADHENHVTNAIPSKIDDQSSSVADMQATLDPGEDGTEVQPTSLAEELQALRKLIVEITGKTYWYETPSTDLSSLSSSSTPDDENNIVANKVFG